MSEVKSPEQEAQEVAAAAQAKQDAKAAADAEKARVKAEKDAASKVAKEAAAEAKAKAKAEKDAVAATVKAEKEKAAAEKAAAKAAKAQEGEQKVKVVMPSKNGVTRPKADGACGKVWELADALSKQLGQPVPIAQLSKATQAAGLNDATTRTQYAKWKTFNSVFGPVPKIVEAPAAPVPQAA